MTTYRTVDIDKIKIFYREAGPINAPVIVLLHGFPSSSHMYRDLIAALQDDYHLIAPDYPGFGNSDRPPLERFVYTFDRLAEVVEKFLQTLGLNKFSLYMQDYGGPIGFRIAVKHPDWIQSLIIQNTNAYEEGLTPIFEHLRPLWEKRTGVNEWRVTKTFKRAGTMWQHTHGVRDKSKVSPDAWNMDQYFLDQPHSHFIQLELQTDFGSNLKRYPEWHDYFRKHQPPTLVVWGRNDAVFSQKGAEMYKRDLKDIEVHFLDTGHFALDEECDVIAGHIRRFLGARNVKKVA